MAKNVAWSVFPVKRNEYGQVTETIQPGDTVTAEKLGISDEEFEYLREAGAIRDEDYPKDLPLNISPAESLRNQEARLRSGTELTPDEMEELVALRAKVSTIVDSGTVSGESVNEDTEKAVAPKKSQMAASDK